MLPLHDEINKELNDLIARYDASLNIAVKQKAVADQEAWAARNKPIEPNFIYDKPTISEEAYRRKRRPVATGVLDYFPLALQAISQVSLAGNEQHNPGKPLHWDRSKSGDEADALIRHFLERGTLDTDGLRHSAKMAWRSLALLQKELEAERDGK